jgi:hypothetical protein
MKRLLTLFVLSVLAAPLAARADGSIQLNASAAVSKPFGDIGNGAKLSDTVDWAFPLAASVAFRVAKQVAVGAYGRFAPATLRSACSGCSANDVGFGAQVEYRFSEKLEGGPWLGASAGYQMLQQKANVSGSSLSSTLSGWEGAFQGGSDFELGGISVGPFLQLAFGEYGTEKVGSSSHSIASKGMHGFFGGGVRLTLVL